MAREWLAGLKDAAAGTGLAAGGAGLVLGAASAIAGVVVARAVVTPPRRKREPVRLYEVDRDAGTITLARTTESTAHGHYSLVYANETGRASLGHIVSETPRTVTRRFGDERGPRIDTVRSVRVVSSPQLEVSDVGIPWTHASIPTDLGEAPAWVFRSARRSADWAIHVHGRGAVLTEPLRTVRIAHEAGWNSLVVSYRNDPVAPASPDRRFGLGATEWRDVDAAMSWAVRHGAERFVLVGWSMGGATVMQALLKSKHKDRIVGVMLESPVVSWRATLRLQGEALNLPRSVTRLGIWILESPFAPFLTGVGRPIPLSELELMARADELEVPILILHSKADNVVPYRPSAALARRRPDLIRYEQFDDALHTRLWNVDTERWEGAVREWFAQFDREDGID